MSFGWYLARPSGPPIGPLRAEALVRRIRGGSLSPAELVWKDGMKGWTKIAQLPELIGDIVIEEPARDTPPETIRESSMRFPDDEAPITKRGAAPAAVLERARGPVRRTTASFDTGVGSFPRVLPEPVGEMGPISEVVGSEHVESIESPPSTRDFGSKGMVIATTAMPGAAAPSASPTPPVEDAPRKVDSLPTHTLRLASAPPRPDGTSAAPPQRGQHLGDGTGSQAPQAPVYDQGPYLQGPYLQLIAEQEIAPPESAAPPPYPSNFPAAEPQPPQQVTVIMPAPPAVAPRPRAIDVVGPVSQVSGAPSAGRGRGAGRVVLVLVTLLALVAGFVAARYVVSRRKMVGHPAAQPGERP